MSNCSDLHKEGFLTFPAMYCQEMNNRMSRIAGSLYENIRTNDSHCGSQCFFGVSIIFTIPPAEDISYEDGNDITPENSPHGSRQPRRTPETSDQRMSGK